MKKIISALVILFLLSTSAMAARVGDIAGDVYPTDIKTYFFDHELNSYNIGGKTVIICEDLGWYFGFYVEWKEEERLLEMTDEAKTTEYIKDISAMGQRNISLQIANRPDDYFNTPAPRHIYHTDIITTLDGKRINSYNVNGRTAIVVEDLRDFGYDVIWNETDRTLKVHEIFENRPIDTEIGSGYLTGGTPTKYYDKTARMSQPIKKLITDEGEHYINVFAGEYYYNDMYPVKETFDILKIAYSFENNILTIDTSNAKSFEIANTDKSHNDLQNYPINYLYVDKVLLNGEETQVTYTAIVGHFDRMHEQKIKADPYICNGKVYVPSSFIASILGK